MILSNRSHRGRYLGLLFAIAGVILLVCARKVLILVPPNVHGHVVFKCGSLSEARSSTIRVNGSLTLDSATCPVRQAETVVSRTDAVTPQPVTVIWSTTGDGLVREISFDVP